MLLKDYANHIGALLPKVVSPVVEVAIMASEERPMAPSLAVDDDDKNDSKGHQFDNTSDHFPVVVLDSIPKTRSEKVCTDSTPVSGAD